MPSYTTNLNLYKYNTTTDGSATFNIDNALNNNWDTVDTEIKANQDDINALDTRLDTAETNITTLDSRTDTAESTLASHASRLIDAETDISDLQDNLISVETDLSNKLDKAGGTITGTLDANITNTENNVTYIATPKCGSYSYDGAITGAIKITLPQSWSATMIRFELDVFNYKNDGSYKILLGGFNSEYPSGWINCYSQVISSSTISDYSVRFGHDGTKCCAFIGELTTVWTYPKIKVKNFIGGHTNSEVAKWAENWNVEIVTEFPTTISVTKTNNFPLSSAAQKLITPRNIALTGDVTGNINFDGSANVSLTTTVADDSHLHDTRYYTKTQTDTNIATKQNKLVKTTHIIETTDFTLASGVYSVNITDTNATANTFVNLLFSSTDILNKVVSGTSTVESNAGYVALKMLKLPTEDITVTLIFSEVS